MTKEEILEKSRKENKGTDEREKQAYDKAGVASRNAALMVCLLLMRLNARFDGADSITWAIFALSTGMGAARTFVMWRNLGKKIDLFYAIAYVLMFLVCIYYFVTYLIYMGG